MGRSTTEYRRFGHPWPWAMVPVFGILSVLLGQDSNWDLANYHLYNPWAFLTARVGVDLAPAGLQSYFNPLIDLPYFWAQQQVDARWVAFAMGAWHGLSLVILLAIVRRVLPMASPRLQGSLALAGCLGPVFVSELGGTMGDNTTAPLLLLGLWCLLHLLGGDGVAARKRLLWCFAAGAAMGVGAGLKLSNAHYLVGASAAILVLPMKGRTRWHAVLCFAVAAAMGLLITCGPWWWRMWQLFGNPLFPQFNNWFGAPLAEPISIGDARWRPQGFVEWLAWPWVFTLNWRRFGEVPMVNLLWPVVYGAAGVVLVRGWWLRWHRPASAAVAFGDAERGYRFVAVFVAASYLVWMALFSIGRYTVVLELLLPLLLWWLLSRHFAYSTAVRLAKVLSATAVLLMVVHVPSWGHSAWASQAYRVEVPRIEQPEKASVLVMTTPIAWMLSHFPPELAFIGDGGSWFPENRAYHERLVSMLGHRGGQVYAIVGVEVDGPARSLSHLNDWMSDYAVPSAGGVCSAVLGLLHRIPKFQHTQLDAGQASTAPGICSFSLPLAQRRDLRGLNRALVDQANIRLAPDGLAIDHASCTQHSAYIGRNEQGFQFCRVGKPSRLSGS